MASSSKELSRVAAQSSKEQIGSSLAPAPRQEGPSHSRLNRAETCRTPGHRASETRTAPRRPSRAMVSRLTSANLASSAGLPLCRVPSIDWDASITCQHIAPGTMSPKDCNEHMAGFGSRWEAERQYSSAAGAWSVTSLC